MNYIYLHEDSCDFYKFLFLHILILILKIKTIENFLLNF